MLKEDSKQRSGFVNLVGLPNSGKSTLFNALVKSKLAIVSAKPQTTRQRVMGILNLGEQQLILSDTPGWIEKTAYPLHKMMNLQIKLAMEDADALVLVIDPKNKEHLPESFITMLSKSTVPIILCINKSDLVSEIDKLKEEWLVALGLPFHAIHLVSARNGTGIDEVLTDLFPLLPIHPPYYEQDFASDRSIRFFLSELIREQIMLHYAAEIPYHCFVVIDSCKGVDDAQPLARIYATIYTGKSSHVPILIGKNGSQLKKIGIASRLEMELFLNQKVYLNLSVKTRKNWRDDPQFVNKSELFQ